jgi:hypothetical protein
MNDPFILYPQMQTQPRDGNDGAVESQEKQNTAFPTFPPPLGNLTKHGEISTFPSHGE